MKPIICILSIVFLLPLAAQSQNTGKRGGSEKILRGNIIDASSGQGLEFATISLFNLPDSHLGGWAHYLKTGGAFEMTAKNGEYYIEVEFISYENQRDWDPISITNNSGLIDLGSIDLNPESTVLEDVVITAEKSETVFALDKRVFTVGKDLANRGGFCRKTYWTMYHL